MKYQIGNFVGGWSAGNTLEEVEKVMYEIGFTKTIKISNDDAPCFRNMFCGYFNSETNVDDLLNDLYDKIKLKLKDSNFGMLQFFLIDLTHTSQIYGVFHDGFY